MAVEDRGWFYHAHLIVRRLPLRSRFQGIKAEAKGRALGDDPSPLLQEEGRGAAPVHCQSSPACLTFTYILDRHHYEFTAAIQSRVIYHLHRYNHTL